MCNSNVVFIHVLLRLMSDVELGGVRDLAALYAEAVAKFRRAYSCHAEGEESGCRCVTELKLLHCTRLSPSESKVRYIVL